MIEPGLSPTMSAASAWRGLVEGPHQLRVNLIQVDPDHATGPAHPVTGQFAVSNEPTHRPIADLQYSAASAMVM